MKNVILFATLILSAQIAAAFPGYPPGCVPSIETDCMICHGVKQCNRKAIEPESNQSTEKKYRVNSLSGKYGQCFNDLTIKSSIGGQIGDVLTVSTGIEGLGVSGPGAYPDTGIFPIGQQLDTNGVLSRSEYTSPATLQITEVDQKTKSTAVITMKFTSGQLEIKTIFNGHETQTCNLSEVQ